MNVRKLVNARHNQTMEWQAGEGTVPNAITEISYAFFQSAHSTIADKKSQYTRRLSPSADQPQELVRTHASALLWKPKKIHRRPTHHMGRAPPLISSQLKPDSSLDCIALQLPLTDSGWVDSIWRVLPANQRPAWRRGIFGHCSFHTAINFRAYLLLRQRRWNCVMTVRVTIVTIVQKWFLSAPISELNSKTSISLSDAQRNTDAFCLQKKHTICDASSKKQTSKKTLQSDSCWSTCK